jgi:hypothetical protein
VCLCVCGIGQSNTAIDQGVGEWHTTIMRKLVNNDNGKHKTDLMCLVLAAFAGLQTPFIVQGPLPDISWIFPRDWLFLYLAGLLMNVYL